MRYQYGYIISLHYSRPSGEMEYITKYFGITDESFQPFIEIMDEEVKIQYYTRLSFEQFSNKFKPYLSKLYSKRDISAELEGTEEKLIETILMALHLCSYVFMFEKFGHPEHLLNDLSQYRYEMGYDYYPIECEDDYYSNTRKDLLNLYILSNSRQKQGKNNNFQIRFADQTIDIDNYQNWFFRLLINSKVSELLDNIKNVDDAKKELIKLEKSSQNSVGRPSTSHYKKIAIYGTYKLISDFFKLKNKPIELLELISHYLEYIDYEECADTDTIRNTINNIERLVKKGGEVPKFYSPVIARMSIEQVLELVKRMPKPKQLFKELYE